jgi:hypothetical protein
LDRVTPTLVQGLARYAERVEQNGLVLRLTLASEERLPEITRWLASQGVGLYHLAARRRSLEAVFLELMQGQAPDGPAINADAPAASAPTPGPLREV